MRVNRTKDFRRIEALPRYKWREDDDLTALLTQALKTPTGAVTLRPVQAAMLRQAYEQRGLFAPVGVGHGKTLVSLLIPRLLDCKRPMLLVPSQLKMQTTEEAIPEMLRHWDFKPPIVRSYNDLSVLTQCHFLEDLKPDLIICDECHHLKRRDSARTRRFLRYFANHEDTKLCCMSGTITKDSLMDYWHLITLALREGSPLPLTTHETQIWDSAVCPHHEKHYEQRAHPGALSEFCQGEETPREGYQRRVNETPGVVATKKSALGTSLVLEKVSPEIPEDIQDYLRDLALIWVTPDGEEITEAVEYQRAAKQLAAGFYYRWVWPNGEKNLQWLHARAQWHRQVRDILQRRYKGLDSPLQVVNAIDSPDDHRFKSIYLSLWRAVRGQYTPITEPVWLSDYLVDYCKQWMDDNKGIVWTEFKSFGEALPRYYGAGRKDAEKLLTTEDRSVCLSIQAHSTGKNLQRWSNNLIVSSPSSGLAYEQLIGRTHRPKQEADQVTVQIIQNTPVLKACFHKAIEEAKYIEESTGQVQKLNFARVI